MADRIPRLGKRPPKVDRRTLRLADYFHISRLDPPPDSDTGIDAFYRAGDPLGNLDYGCCVLSAAANLIMGWAAQAGRPVTITAAQVVATYKQMTGCQAPGDANDTGLNPLDVLKVWRSDGLWGHKISAYAALRNGDYTQSRYAVHYLGGAFIGVALPDTNTFGPWLTPSGPPDPYNGHMIEYPRFVPGKQTAYTWGEEIDAGDSWHAAYNDEGYIVFSQDWLDANGLSPDKFDASQLLADVAEISGQPTPPVPVPTLTLTATPETITLGESATLAWSSADADSCVLVTSDGHTMDVAPSGTMAVTPSITTSYTITATGPGGSIGASVKVVVSSTPVPPPPTPPGPGCLADVLPVAAAIVVALIALGTLIVRSLS